MKALTQGKELFKHLTFVEIVAFSVYVIQHLLTLILFIYINRIGMDVRGPHEDESPEKYEGKNNLVALLINGI